jgi:hypothetical protein
MSPAQNTLAIIQAVADKHKVTVSDIMGRDRHKQINEPRQEAMYEVLIQRRHLTYPDIGRIFGRDHTTVISNVKAHCKRQGIDYDAATVRFRRIPSFNLRKLSPAMFLAYGAAMRGERGVGA